MIRVRWAAAASVSCLLVMAGGCSDGPKRINFAEPLPQCSVFVSVLTEQGMPDPQPLAGTTPSPGSNGFDCTFAAVEGSKPPAIATASILVSRPTYQSDQKDPAKRYGGVFVVQNDCAGAGAGNPALPSGESCYQAQSPHDAFIAVSSITEHSGVHVDLQWSDPDTTADQLRRDALGKANAVAQSVIGML